MSENNDIKIGGGGKIWELRSPDPNESELRDIYAIADALGLSHVTARLLWGRGYKTPADASCFLSMGDALMHDPFLLPGMQEAVERIEAALADPEEHIVIYGDYDVDGVTSVSTLRLYLSSRAPELLIDHYIPSRTEEGYGMTCAALDKIAERGATLIITVDTGITAEEEVRYAAELGIDVIITDHHECRETLPNAVAVIDPHRSDSPYPFCELAGVGVVFKLISACELARARKEGRSDADAVRGVFADYADLTAIGTIADVMPLIDENRLIVAYGLSLIEHTKRPGLCALLDAVQSGQGTRSADGTAAAPKKRRINAGFIGFGIAPRINAAGRMAHANIAAELFLTSDRKRADELAATLCNINRERQIEENRTAEEAFAKIEEECDLKEDRVIVVAGDSWKQGIIGIVASRVVEKYGMPAILITFDGSHRDDDDDDEVADEIIDEADGDDDSAVGCDDDTAGGKRICGSPTDIGKGSGRSVRGINLCDALTSCADILTRYGGHELAAGLSVERGKVDEFRRRINEYARRRLGGEEIRLTVTADCEVAGGELSMHLAEELRAMEPCGVANPTPSFILREATVMRITPIGAGKHTKLMINANVSKSGRAGGTILTALWFGMQPSSLEFRENDSIDLLFTLDINEFRGVSSLQLLITDARLSRGRIDEKRRDRELYESIMSGAVAAEPIYLPERADFTAAYRAVCRELEAGRDTFAADIATHLVGARMNPIKFRIILSVFAETGIFAVEEPRQDIFRLSQLPRGRGKVDLEGSGIMRRLRAAVGTNNSKTEER